MRREAVLAALARIQALVRSGTYMLLPHAVEEAVADDLHRIDVEAAVLTGDLVRVQEDDDRGPRFTIIGRAADLRRRLGVVARFSPQFQCVIITVYELKEE